MNMLVDSDNAKDIITIMSQTVILLYLNSAPIYWYPQKENTTKISTLVS